MHTCTYSDIMIHDGERKMETQMRIGVIWHLIWGPQNGEDPNRHPEDDNVIMTTPKFQQGASF